MAIENAVVLYSLLKKENMDFLSAENEMNQAYRDIQELKKIQAERIKVLETKLKKAQKKFEKANAQVKKDFAELIRLDLKVPYSDRDIVKDMGAEWDPEKKVWYISIIRQDADLFIKYLT